MEINQLIYSTNQLQLVSIWREGSLYNNIIAKWYKKIKSNVFVPLGLDFNRSSRPEVFCKKVVLRNFAEFTGKHPCQSLFKKETLAHVFSCEFCKISKNTFVYRTPLVAASDFKWVTLIYKRNLHCKHHEVFTSKFLCNNQKQPPLVFSEKSCS